ncbi:NADPH-dependent FMN reductase [Streptomyces shenzhenensis]|uniref:NADPH-dependent FMN reductase n=1 Tax=Streptomyces shenzhenensis TaxID=943815 RepID=UPI003D916ED2
MKAFTPRRLLVLAGAAARPSRTLAVAESVSRHIAATGSRPILRDLADQSLPPLHTGDQPPDALADLRHQAAKADALVWVTPCYHGSYSGLLKTALDHLCEPDLKGKPVGLVAVGASLTAVQACDHLRSVARALGCIAVPTHAVVTPPAIGTPDDTPGTDAARITRMISEIHVLADATWQLRRDPTPVFASSGAGP